MQQFQDLPFGGDFVVHPACPFRFLIVLSLLALAQAIFHRLYEQRTVRHPALTNVTFGARPTPGDESPPSG